jgi:aspartate carbamoyltransferase catalytic subunit
MVLKNLIESQQLSRELLEKIFSKADILRKSCLETLKGKILVSLFYEPSTRTRLSFESAMIRLGGSVIGTENAKEFSSAIKGESLEDSIRVLSGYADCIVMRHNEQGAAQRASKVSKIPVINAGDGKGQHPTQAILDVYTLYKEFGKIDGLKVAMVGDLASGRTVRSLCYLLGKFKDIKIIFVSPENLKMSEDIKQYLKEKDILFEESENLEEVLSYADVIYMTRIQKERISQSDYESAKGRFLINEKNLEKVGQNSRILHPLPHVEEIDIPVEIEENDIRIAYFRQAENGLYCRMALLDLMLS